MTDSTALRVADLPQNTATPFDLTPDATTLRSLAEELGLLALRKLRFSGEISAQGQRDWQLSGRLGATVVQPCSITLDPVTTRIDTDVRRTYVADLPEIEAEEAEMPADDTVDALGRVIDPAAVMAEALALALPLYPRKDGVSLDTNVFAEPGIAPMRDEDARPFAGLADLRDSLKKKT